MSNSPLTSTEQPTVIVLPPNLRNPLRTSLNRGLMAAWIGADLTTRSHLDVDTAFVFYNGAGIFEMALVNEPSPELLQRLYAATRIRYWTRGIR